MLSIRELRCTINQDLFADERVATLSQARQMILVIWDESVIEKPEGLYLEGPCGGAFQQGLAAQTHQTRLLQPTRWQTDLRTRLSLVTSASHRDGRSCHHGKHAVVDHMWGSGYQ